MSQNGMLPDVQTAYNNIFDGVHAKVFFHKCAAAGFAPSTREEAQAMLETAGKLRQISQLDQVKQAEAQDNPLVQMNRGLDTIMAQYGLSTAPVVDDVDMLKRAADTLMDDPVLYNSVLSLKANEAEQLRAHYSAQS